ncbi:hypothetical protein ACQP1P_35415 [Dactylosporangium sp. CA-052675]|uniref:hypothetical protein n=1 Tax=Dactylosporangium sp. CA-052675 TaxID=3239927 RepID=UPI003D8B3377
MDSAIVRAHQGGTEGHSDSGQPAAGPEPAHAIRRSRCGLTTKIHLVRDGARRVLGLVATGGNVNDDTRFKQCRETLLQPAQTSKECQSAATRYDKTTTSFWATITIAALLQWP